MLGRYLEGLLSTFELEVFAARRGAEGRSDLLPHVVDPASFAEHVMVCFSVWMEEEGYLWLCDDEEGHPAWQQPS
jgi:hypothetical protein